MIVDLDEESFSKHARTVMIERGLLAPGRSVAETIDYFVDEVCQVDAELGGVDTDKFRSGLTTLIREGVVVLGTPLLQNILRRSRSTAACTVLCALEEGHFDTSSELLRTSAALLSDGTGVGFDLSSLPFPDLSLPQLNAHLREIDRELRAENRRPAASMATLRDDHPRILPFIRAKCEVDFAEWRLNVSIFTSQAFFDAVEANGAWHLRNEGGEIVNTIMARDLLREIAVAAHYCGDPGLLFRDRIEIDNPTPQWSYVSTAPCAELAMAQGDACHFSYVNVGRLVQDGKLALGLFEDAATYITRMLDAATEITARGCGDILWLVEQKRRIGVGITGFADFLILMQLPYDSRAAADAAAELAEYLDFFTKRASVELARQRKPFPAIAKSRYIDREWVGRKLVDKRLKIDPARWNALIEDILKYGVRNASTTSMPPSGTSSEIVGISKSLEPYLSLREPGGSLYRVFRDLGIAPCSRGVIADCDAELLSLPFISLAQDIEPLSHLAIQAAFQSFLDDGISKTVNFSRDATIDDIYSLFHCAYRYGVKGVTVFRDNCLSERAGHTQQ